MLAKSLWIGGLQKTEKGSEGMIGMKAGGIVIGLMITEGIVTLIGKGMGLIMTTETAGAELLVPPDLLCQQHKAYFILQSGQSGQYQDLISISASDDSVMLHIMP